MGFLVWFRPMLEFFVRFCLAEGFFLVWFRPILESLVRFHPVEGFLSLTLVHFWVLGWILSCWRVYSILSYHISLTFPRCSNIPNDSLFPHSPLPISNWTPHTHTHTPCLFLLPPRQALNFFPILESLSFPKSCSHRYLPAHDPLGTNIHYRAWGSD